MLQNPVLDVAIGMIALFLVASLLVTALQEAIAQLLDLRAKTLRAAIGRMLDGQEAGGEHAEAFFAHPLIASLNTRGPGIGPSYIPRGIFTQALRDIAAAKQAATGFLDAAKDLPANAPPMQAVLKRFAGDAADGLAAIDKEVGDWFDAVMERVSGLYKRKAQALAFGFGLAVAVGGNLDAVAVGGHLATSPAARQAMAEAVSGAAKQQAEFDAGKLGKALADAGAMNALPIGWGKPFQATAPLGWLVTALAAMLGAAFWFDLLKTFVNIRASGPPPARRSRPEQGAGQ